MPYKVKPNIRGLPISFQVQRGQVHNWYITEATLKGVIRSLDHTLFPIFLYHPTLPQYISWASWCSKPCLCILTRVSWISGLVIRVKGLVVNRALETQNIARHTHSKALGHASRDTNFTTVNFIGPYQKICLGSPDKFLPVNDRKLTWSRHETKVIFSLKWGHFRHLDTFMSVLRS